MQRRVLVFTQVMLAAVTPAVALAQNASTVREIDPATLVEYGGGYGGCEIGEGLECFSMTRSAGRDLTERQWLRAVVLWSPTTAVAECRWSDSTVRRIEAERYQQQQRAREIRREAITLMHCGQTLPLQFSRWNMAPGASDTLFVLDRQFLVPRVTDSALVVLLGPGSSPDGAPRVVAATSIPATIDDTYWGKHWAHGDTLFSIHPRNREATLRAALSVNPAVRAFLARTSSTRAGPSR